MGILQPEVKKLRRAFSAWLVFTLFSITFVGGFSLAIKWASFGWAMAFFTLAVAAFLAFAWVGVLAVEPFSRLVMLGTKSLRAGPFGLFFPERLSIPLAPREMRAYRALLLQGMPEPQARDTAKEYAARRPSRYGPLVRWTCLAILLAIVSLEVVGELPATGFEIVGLMVLTDIVIAMALWNSLTMLMKLKTMQ